ncbi:hypothetical protein [Marinobacter sp. F3R11]|uniref:hypothetical protein n=1 Tax=Marinobacter sp. F3R11 TaxID=2267231 RepID=UPI000DEB4646|nr:hypothetical protein [Marinobacter sp. F3R11]RBW49314.1 hypothetical protein DS878_14500 [Marinobacter sp. F3R11]
MNEGSSMTPQGITVVAIKFFALYLVFNILWYAPTISVYVSTYTELLETSSTQNFLIYLVAIFIAIGLIAAVGMILVANSIIRKVPADPIETTEGFSPQLLFQLIGLYFVVTALSEFPMATRNRWKVRCILAARWFNSRLAFTWSSSQDHGSDGSLKRSARSVLTNQSIKFVPGR